jgi:hypothetical protein
MTEHKKAKHQTKQKLISIVKADIPDEKHLLFTGFIVVLTSLVVINTIFWLDRNPGTNVKLFRAPNAAPSNTKVLASQQAGTTPAYDVVITNVSEQDKFDPAFTIADDETVLILDISITNKSGGQQDLVPVNQLYARSRDGDYFAMHASSLITKPLAATTLDPGQNASGQVSFVVPKSLAHPLLYVDLGWNDYAPLVYDVLR